MLSDAVFLFGVGAVLMVLAVMIYLGYYIYCQVREDQDRDPRSDQ
jgi:hypothetical protein